MTAHPTDGRWVDIRAAHRALGVTPQWVRRLVEWGRLPARETRAAARNGRAVREVWVAGRADAPPKPVLLTEDDHRREIERRLRGLPAAERAAYARLLAHVASIVEDCRRLIAERRAVRGNEFSPEWQAVARRSAFPETAVVRRDRRWARPRSADGVYRWVREWETRYGYGLAFLPSPPAARRSVGDEFHPAIAVWLEEQWERHATARALHAALRTYCAKEGLKSPSYATTARWLALLPAAARSKAKSKEEYNSRHRLYTPRDYRDLLPGQVLVGDHMSADVCVVVDVPDVRRGGYKPIVARPWWTVWQDARTGLIWGWYISLQPSSRTALLAYVQGAKTWGAQPSGDVQSYLYTDHGRDYKSRAIGGDVVAVHQRAFALEDRPDGVRATRASLLSDLGLERRLARPYAPWEKFVERTFGALHRMEQEQYLASGDYCGPTPDQRPDANRRKWAEHQRAVKANRASPFVRWDDYLEWAARAVERYNMTPHLRTTGETEAPAEAWARLATHRYEISSSALLIMAMSTGERVVAKGRMIRLETLYFHHPALEDGARVEVRYDPSDLSHVWVWGDVRYRGERRHHEWEAERRRSPRLVADEPPEHRRESLRREWVRAEQVAVRGLIEPNIEAIRARREAETRMRIEARAAREVILGLLRGQGALIERRRTGTYDELQEQARRLPVVRVATRYDAIELSPPPSPSPSLIPFERPSPRYEDLPDDDFRTPSDAVAPPGDEPPPWAPWDES